uniref:Tyrosine-protein kinase ephrin type A/B receptor-like domain-containing protein n=1 Tax=Tetradesmus obliquus TaxID=3088 RepID=A0A383V8T7_TETOB|eukprot:jgi/Sobl393_1/15008/SZX61987.1
MMCLSCTSPGYSVTADADSCECSAGYYNENAACKPCGKGSYSVGGRSSKCTDCPGGLVTEGMASGSVDACAAPPGHFCKDQHAVQCSVGTYQDGITKSASCKACPVGLTTKDKGSASAAACSITLAGYRALYDSKKHVIGAEPCPAGTFSPAGAAVCRPAHTDYLLADVELLPEEDSGAATA